MDRADATALIEKYKAEAEAEVTASYAKELFGFIIGYSLSGSRRALMEQMEREASNSYKTAHYEIALDRFCHYLALVETDPSTTVVSEMRATLTSNIGSCLHQLGNIDAAQDYFERALQEFKAQPFTLMSRISLQYVIFGNLVDKRCAYIEAKLASIRAGEPPDPTTYQDGYGKTRKWSESEMQGKPTFSVLDPRTWFGYGKVHEVGVVPNGVATAA